jgi:hypothetical protein
METQEVYRKRRRLALDYWNQIPPAKVYPGLRWFIGGTGKEIQQHEGAVGLDALSCGTVACVAGWLYTMPEFREWTGTQFDDGTYNHLYALERFLGVQDSRLFRERDDADDKFGEGLSDHEVGRRRLQQLVGELL